MILTLEEALTRVAERTAENKRRIDRELRQRRNQVVDMYGVEYTRQGGENAPAKFYISISPDMVYLERFEFKLIVQPFLSTSGGVGPATLDLRGVGSGSHDTVTPTEVANMLDITPNPHTHNVTAGISQITTTANDFRISVEGIDITPYLMAQYGGNWLDGEGVYPSLEIGEDYDILEVASDLIGEGRDADADKLLRPGYKAIEISAGGAFSITLVNYLKYSHLNR